jgi:two-component system, LytTR family, sensor kinase
MNLSIENNKNETFYKILFQVFLWVIWIFYPFINANYDEPDTIVFLKMLVTVRLVEVPFFYLIVYYLIPKILRKKGVTTYLILVFIISVSYIYLESILKVWVNPDYKNIYTFFIFFPVIFVAAMGTGFGLVTAYVDEESIKREVNQERLRSELSFLRSQISPHFIFNVLNSIVYLIRTRSSEAENVTIQLSELIRYMLYETDTKQVPVSREVEYLKNYIELQKVRYGEDVEINVSISGNDSSLTIEPMLLIPFVENAFKHGIGMVTNPKIDIVLSYDTSVLNFQVTNPIGPETMEQKDGSSGIGLKNVSRRLELLYKGKHELYIDNNGKEFTARLKINLKREPN